MTTDAPAEVCFTNITRAGRRRRVVFGVVTIALALGAFAVLRAFHVSAIVRLVVANVLVASGATSIFQATQNT